MRDKALTSRTPRRIHTQRAFQCSPRTAPQNGKGTLWIREETLGNLCYNEKYVAATNRVGLVGRGVGALPRVGCPF